MGKAEIEPRNLAEEEEQLRRRIRHGEDTEDECFGGVEPQPASAVCLILHLLVVVKVKMNAAGPARRTSAASQLTCPTIDLNLRPTSLFSFYSLLRNTLPYLLP